MAKYATIAPLLMLACSWAGLFAQEAGAAATGQYFFSSSPPGVPVQPARKGPDPYYSHDDRHGIWYYYDAEHRIDYVYDLESGSKFAVHIGKDYKVYELEGDQFSASAMPRDDRGMRLQLHLNVMKGEFQRLGDATHAPTTTTDTSSRLPPFLKPPSSLLHRLGDSVDSLMQSARSVSPSTSLMRKIDQNQESIDAGLVTRVMNYISCFLGRSRPEDAHYSRKGTLPCIKPPYRPSSPRFMPQAVQKYERKKARAKAELETAIQADDYKRASNILRALRAAHTQAQRATRDLQLSVASQMDVQREQVFKPKLGKIETHLHQARADLAALKSEFERALRANGSSDSAASTQSLIERMREQHRLIHDLKAQKKGLKFREKQVRQRFEHEAGLDSKSPVLSRPANSSDLKGSGSHVQSLSAASSHDQSVPHGHSSTLERSPSPQPQSQSSQHSSSLGLDLKHRAELAIQDAESLLGMS